MVRNAVSLGKKGRSELNLERYPHSPLLPPPSSPDDFSCCKYINYLLLYSTTMPTELEEGSICSSSHSLLLQSILLTSYSSYNFYIMETHKFGKSVRLIIIIRRGNIFRLPLFEQQKRKKKHLEGLNEAKKIEKLTGFNSR